MGTHRGTPKAAAFARIGVVALGLFAAASFAGGAGAGPSSAPLPTASRLPQPSAARGLLLDAGAHTASAPAPSLLALHMASNAATERASPEAGVVESKVLDGGIQIYKFSALDIEGRLKSPQLIYFLRRVRAEFAAGELGHRSFLREMAETRKEPSF